MTNKLTEIKNYGKIHSGMITSIDGCENYDYVFTSDNKGELMMICLKYQNVIRSMGNITNEHGIRQISIMEPLENHQRVSKINTLPQNYNTSNKHGQKVDFVNLIVISDDYDVFKSGDIMSSFIHDIKGNSISKNNGTFDPEGLCYFSCGRDLNYISSLLLNTISDPDYHTDIMNFLLDHKQVIFEHFSHCATISLNDVAIMMLTYEYFGLDSNIPCLFKYLNK